MASAREKTDPIGLLSRDEESDGYALLNDMPIQIPEDDLLGMRETAVRIARRLRASTSASPFVMAVDAGWGMGKSTLLRQIKDVLESQDSTVDGLRRSHWRWRKRHPADPIRTIWFNAWTTEGDDALAGLIKSVLEKMDPSIIRKTLRTIMRRKRAIGVARILLGVAAWFFGVTRPVDDLCRQLSLDVESRNRLRDDICGMLADWMKGTGDRADGRCMVVFIDDLDRCPDEVIVKVCEAVKLYLDAPGLIFVLGCDQSVLARGVAGQARGGPDDGRFYLEKIVQVYYRIPPPDDAAIITIIRGYAQQSGIQHLITNQIGTVIAAGSRRNPRTVKRIINSFILEHELNPVWQSQPVNLAIAIVLQHQHPPFYDLLVSDRVGEDPIGDLLGYAEACQFAAAFPHMRATQDAPQFFRLHGVDLNEIAEGNNTIGVQEILEQIRQLDLPAEFPRLADDSVLLAFLQGAGDGESRRNLRRQLFHTPLATETVGTATPASAASRTPSYDQHPEDPQINAGGPNWLNTLLSRPGSRFERAYLESVRASAQYLDNKGLPIAESFRLPKGAIAPSLVLRNLPGDGLLSETVGQDAQRWSLAQLLEQDTGRSGLLVIIGAPGSGKTTLLRHAAYEACESARSRRSGPGLPTIPILLYVREQASSILFNPRISLDDLLISSPFMTSVPEPSGWFREKLASGQCLVLLDGLDEVSNPSDSRVVSEWIERQMLTYPRNRFVVSTRPTGYISGSITGAQVAQMAGLTADQARNFLYQWYRTASEAAPDYAGARRTEIDRAAEQKSDELWQLMQGIPGMRELAMSPMLLTMIANTHYHMGTLPQNRAHLYEKICQIMLWRRAEAKGLRPRLAGRDKMSILAEIAYDMMEQQSSHLSGDQILSSTRAALRFLNRNVTPEDFLVDTLVDGLLVETMPVRYEFAHHTFQEYLASFCIRERDKVTALIGHIGDPWWTETIIFYAAQADASRLVNACLEDKTTATLALALECAKVTTDLDPKLRNQVDELLRTIDGPDATN